MFFDNIEITLIYRYITGVCYVSLMYHCFTDVLLASTQFRKSQDYLEFFKIALINSFFSLALYDPGIPKRSRLLVFNEKTTLKNFVKFV